MFVVVPAAVKSNAVACVNTVVPTFLVGEYLLVPDLTGPENVVLDIMFFLHKKLGLLVFYASARTV